MLKLKTGRVKCRSDISFETKKASSFAIEKIGAMLDEERILFKDKITFDNEIYDRLGGVTIHFHGISLDIYLDPVKKKIFDIKNKYFKPPIRI